MPSVVPAVFVALVVLTEPRAWGGGSDPMLEAARSAALSYAQQHAFPPDQIAKLSEPPMSTQETTRTDGTPAVRYQWLGNGKGGGWFLHVLVSKPSLQAEASGGNAVD